MVARPRGFRHTARSRPMAAQLLLGTPDEVALALACAFGNPVDLLRLACACRRYRLKIVAAAESCDAVGQARSDGTGDGSGGGGTDDGVTRLPPERWSIASEAARRWLAGCPAAERGWVPKRPGDCWLGLMHELQRLRLPPLFTHKHRNVELSQGGAVATKYSGPSRGNGWCAAVVGGLSVVGSTSGDTTPKMHQCGVRMRAGRHFAQFSQCGGRQKNFFVGLIQPDSRSVAYRWDLQKDCASCFYHSSSGKRWPGNDGWEGMQAAEVQEGTGLAVRIGLLLDLDAGTLTIFKNSQRLGVMATDLSGEYYWAVSLLYPSTAVCIETAACPIVPASP